jgi:hypothetical protein
MWDIFLQGHILSVGGDALIASPAVLSMWSCTVKMDEENPTYAGLTQENSFALA